MRHCAQSHNHTTEIAHNHTMLNKRKSFYTSQIYIIFALY